MRRAGLSLCHLLMESFERCTVLLIVICATCLIVLFLEFDHSEKSGFAQDPSFGARQQGGSEQQSGFPQQLQDDMTVLLQERPIKVQRLIDDDLKDQTQRDEANLLELPHQAEFKSLPTSALSVLLQNTTRPVCSRVNILKNSFLSLLSKLRSTTTSGHNSINMQITRTRSSETMLLVVMSFTICIAACVFFLPESFFGSNHPRRLLAQTGSHPHVSSATQIRPGMNGSKASPMTGQHSVRNMSVQETPLVANLPTTQQDDPFPLIAPLSRPSPLPSRSHPVSNLSFPAAQSPPPTLATMPDRLPDEDLPLARQVTPAMPPPLCPTLVLPGCEARFGVPVSNLRQLSTEGDLPIVGLSGNPLLRASVLKLYGGRALTISMLEPGSAPRATIQPSHLDTGDLEIRGPKGFFYGMLEMTSSHRYSVKKDEETLLVIEGDTESLQLNITAASGMALASVRVSSENFGGVSHVEIRVELGVDTVLVLACVLAVLLWPPMT